MQSEPLQSQHLKEAVRHRNELQCLMIVEQEKLSALNTKIYPEEIFYNCGHCVQFSNEDMQCTRSLTTSPLAPLGPAGPGGPGIPRGPGRPGAPATPGRPCPTEGKKGIISPLSFLLH